MVIIFKQRVATVDDKLLTYRTRRRQGTEGQVNCIADKSAKTLIAVRWATSRVVSL